MPDTNNNFNIEVANLTDSFAKMASDWHVITQNSGITSVHYQILKASFGNQLGSTRNDELYPIPTTIRSHSGPLVGITGTIRATGSFASQNLSDNNLIIGTNNTITGYRSIPAIGHIQGISNSKLLEITGFMIFATGYTLYVQGVTNGSFMGITEGRKLNINDTLGITGTIGLSGGTTLIAGKNSIVIRGHDLSDKIPVRFYGSNGQTLGLSGNALNLNIVGADLSIAYNIGTSLGVCNENGAALKICGSGIASSPAVVIQGKMSGGILEVGTTFPVKISTTGSMDLDDALLINSIESTTKPLILNSILIKNNTSQISNISQKITSNVIQAKITEIDKPIEIVNGIKDLTNSPIPINSNFPIKNGVHLKAPISNTKSIYVGSKSIERSFLTGFVLNPGESIFIEIDNMNKIYASCEFFDQKIAYLGS